MIVLSAQNVRKTYGEKVALEDVNLTLYQGEIRALLGSNGSGKTTLIKILTTLLARDSGTVNIMGYDLSREEEQIRHLIGYVGQDTERSAYARLTVRENLMFFGSLRNLKKAELKARIQKLAEYFDFEKQLDSLFHHLSGGQKQTVVIMRALLHDPPLIYLDEPTKGLDPIISKRIRTYLKSYVMDERKTLLLTSHILTEVEEMADRVSLIHRGTIPITEKPDVLKAGIGVNDFIEIRRDALPEATLEKILKLDTVMQMLDRDPEWASIGVHDFFDGTESILRVMREDNVRAQIRHHQATLEDAFIRQLGALSEQFEK